MSDRDFRLYCADVLDSGAAILEFVKDLTFEEFCADRKTYSAVIREFEIIGEAVGKLPGGLKRNLLTLNSRISRIFEICSAMNISGSIWRLFGRSLRMTSLY